MTGWYLLTCIHGRQEGLDSHDCPSCLERALKEGKDCSNGQTWIYPQSDKVERNDNHDQNSSKGSSSQESINTGI